MISEVIDGLVTWLTPQLSSLSPAPAYLGWDKSMGAKPSYPTKPTTDCPRILIRVRDDLENLQAGRVHKFALSIDLIVQLRQTPGQNHQKLLIEYMDAIREPFLTNAATLALCSLGIEFVQVARGSVLDELRHPFDEPRLRVSTGKIEISAILRRGATI